MSDDRTLALREETPAKARELAQLIKTMLPNGQKLSEQEALAGAMYGIANNLSPFKGEYYIVPGKGIYPGYRGEVRMQEHREYYTQVRALTAEEASEHEINPGDSARVVELYQPDLMAQMRTMGVNYRPIVGVGIVRKSEKYKSEDWVGEYPNRKRVKLDPPQPIDPPTGRSWAWKAEQRALKDAMRHMQGGADILDETVQDQLADAAQNADALIAEVRNLPPVEQQEQLQTRVNTMRGDPERNPFDDPAPQRPEPVILPSGRVFMSTEDRERADAAEAAEAVDGEFTAVPLPEQIRVRIQQQSTQGIANGATWKGEPTSPENVKKMNAGLAILLPQVDQRRKVREYLLRHDSNSYTKGEIAALVGWLDMRKDADGATVPSAQAIADAKELIAFLCPPEPVLFEES